MNRMRVMYVEDCVSKMVIWTQMGNQGEGESYFEVFGKFVHEAIMKIQTECAYQGIKPCIHISPKGMSEEDFNKLTRDTISAELEGLMASVERDDRS